jgi:hypothetical protein
MAEPFLPASVSAPDFYIAAMGRSGSTLLCNWLTRAPDRVVFMEPFFLRDMNSRLLRIQLEQIGMAASDDEWVRRPDEDARSRFARLMGPRLAGRHWALKEVVAEEHDQAIAQLRPKKLIISVRDIVDVALSFFEKHRRQDNLDRFTDEWVATYCERESAALARLRREADERGLPCFVVHYEKFTQDDETRGALERFVGWRGGGDVAAGLDRYERSFEVERHGEAISARILRGEERFLDDDHRHLAEIISRKCREYQGMFGYQTEINEDLPTVTRHLNYSDKCRNSVTPASKLLANTTNT